LSAWRRRSCGILAGVGTALAVTACGSSGQNQSAGEPKGKFPVAIATAAFPSSQRLAEHTHLVIAVRNTGHKTIPDVAVSICNVTCRAGAPPGEGTSAAAFSLTLNQQYLANASRPVWVVDRAPGHCGYSCQGGGPGAAVTAYSNTWALGQLKPGQTARFDWAVTPVTPGRHVVAWQVAAGLSGNAKAVLASGAQPQGTFSVSIDRAPQQSYVNNNGQVVSQ
jgi:hypothetical protein